MRKNNNTFFEVSINSQKLCQHLSNIQKIINEQQSRMEEINKRLTHKLVEVKESIQKIDIQVKRNQKQLKQSILNEALIQKDQLKKIEAKAQQFGLNMQATIGNINYRMAEQKEKAEIISNKTQYAFQQCKEIKIVKNLISNMEKEIGEIKSDTFRKIIQESLDKAHEEKMNQICQDNFFKILENDRIRQIILKKQCAPSESQRPPKRSLRENQAMFYASISDKLDKLQKKLIQKNNEQLNKVLYPSKISSNFNPVVNLSAIRISEVGNAQQKDDVQQSQLMKDVVSKIDSIEIMITKKVADLKKELVKELDKSQLMNEKINILSKKLQKQKTRLNDFMVQFKKYSQKKLDQKVIESFRYEIRQRTLDYQDNLDSKINKDFFDKEKNKTNERIKIIHENLTEKADKSEIKKAITFLQSKIKQIILLVAGSYDQDREGSIKKTPFKCLSCDKDLDTKLLQLKEHFKENMGQTQTQEVVRGFKKSQSATKLRCSTSRMRRHLRLNSGSTTPSNFPVSPFAFD